MAVHEKEGTVAQDWNAKDYGEKLRFITEMGLPLIDLLAPKPGERILDLGCGDGALTKLLVQSGVEVVGIDASPDMIAVAKAEGLDAHVMDARFMPFEQEFDGVLSNATLHWIPDAQSVSDAVMKALRPGGRYVAEFGGHENVRRARHGLNTVRKRWGLGQDDINPWYFPTAEHHRACLEKAGFDVLHIETYDRPTPMRDRMVIWLENFGKSFVSDVPPERHREFFEEAEAVMAPEGQNDDGTWTIDYVRCRFEARKPG